MAEKEIRVNVRLDPATVEDLRALEQYLRSTTSGAVRLAIAELARKYGLRTDGGPRGELAAAS